jgi:hypothetical protein
MKRNVKLLASSHGQRFPDRALLFWGSVSTAHGWKSTNRGYPPELPHCPHPGIVPI